MKIINISKYVIKIDESELIVLSKILKSQCKGDLCRAIPNQGAGLTEGQYEQFQHIAKKIRSTLKRSDKL